MKKQTLPLASICLAIGLAVAPAYAQSGGVQAKIPFDFTVAGKTFLAGAYTMIVGSHQVAGVHHQLAGAAGEWRFDRRVRRWPGERGGRSA